MPLPALHVVRCTADFCDIMRCLAGRKRAMISRSAGGAGAEMTRRETFFRGISPEPESRFIHLRGTRKRPFLAPGSKYHGMTAYLPQTSASEAAREPAAPQRRSTASPCDGFRLSRWFGRRCRGFRGAPSIREGRIGRIGPKEENRRDRGRRDRGKGRRRTPQGRRKCDCLPHRG